MVSQKNLSHSSLIERAAPPRRPRRRPGISRFLLLGKRASSLDEVNAARGGLVGGEGRPEEGTSGIPLGPWGRKKGQHCHSQNKISGYAWRQRRGCKHTCEPRSAVVEALEVGNRVDDVAGGKDIDILGNDLAVVTTTIEIFVFHWRHCFRFSRG